jgi:hypothetical protein
MCFHCSSSVSGLGGVLCVLLVPPWLETYSVVTDFCSTRISGSSLCWISALILQPIFLLDQGSPTKRPALACMQDFLARSSQHLFFLRPAKDFCFRSILFFDSRIALNQVLPASLSSLDFLVRCFAAVKVQFLPLKAFVFAPVLGLLL